MMGKNFLSDRIINLGESETLAMAKKSRELRSQGYDIINLSIGEPDFDTPLHIKEAAKQAIDNNFSHYPPVAGYVELRESISRKLKRDNNLEYGPGQIVVSGGAKQSLANAIFCLVNPGDEVIIPSPYWVSYKELVKLAEGKRVFIEGKIEHDFKITPQQLEAAITTKTKLFLFSSPCNPTGSVYSFEELEKLAAVFARNPHIYILSDEIYEHINYNGKHQSIAQFGEIKDRVVVVNGLSKGFAMTGWRLGFMAANPGIANACEKLQGQYTSGTNSITQRAAITAFDTDPATSSEIREMLKAFVSRRDLMLGLLKRVPGFRLNIPEGAFYLFIDVSELLGKRTGDHVISTAADLCDYLLGTAHVALVPGAAFGSAECIRLSYATSEDLLRESCRRIYDAVIDLR
jgi:aspartate aminotransferase